MVLQTALTFLRLTQTLLSSDVSSDWVKITEVSEISASVVERAADGKKTRADVPRSRA